MKHISIFKLFNPGSIRGGGSKLVSLMTIIERLTEVEAILFPRFQEKIQNF